jgi:hypothetical protein
MAEIESLSSCAPQLNFQPAPPIAQAPTPRVVIERSLLPSCLVMGIVCLLHKLSQTVSVMGYETLDETAKIPVQRKLGVWPGEHASGRPEE